MKSELFLEICKRSDDDYQKIRDRHYVENKGTHGQQVHFKIFDSGELVGIISGASAVYAVASRDNFFRIPSGKDERQKLFLPSIVNNTVFRLEKHTPNLGSRVLSLWRTTISKVWEQLYEVPVIGFETFVVEEEYRKGSMYLADNWTKVGVTSGSTKAHANGAASPHERVETIPKLVFCKWNGRPAVPKVEYVSSWRQSTVEEKARAKRIALVRNEIVGERFYS